MEGTSCSNLRKPIGCRLTDVRGVYLSANTTYYVTIIPITYIIGESIDLIITPTTVRPVNDDCQNAITIASSVALPHTITTKTLITNATIQPNERIPSCDRFVKYTTMWFNSVRYVNYKNNFGGHSIWYKYTPPTTGYYNFTTLGTLSLLDNLWYSASPITIAVYEAIDGGGHVCSNMTNLFNEVYCSRSERFAVDRNDELKGGKQYYIQLVPDMYDRIVSTNVMLTINRAEVPAINDKCSDAIVLNPIVGVSNLSIGLAPATSDALYHPDGLSCGVDEYAKPVNFLPHGVWYKYIHTGGITEIVHQVCEENIRGNVYYVFTGNDCNNLTCAGEFPVVCSFPAFTYTAEQPTTYWFLLRIWDTDLALPYFTLSFNRRNDFRLINALWLLYPNHWRDPLTTTKLNIDAYFQPGLNVQSTRIIYTNPNFTRCETTKPFSVFGNKNGNYRPGLISIGTHRITAIPYAQPRRQGAPITGATLTKRLTMLGCRVNIFFHETYSEPLRALDATKIPCAAILGGTIDCSFLARNITIDLYNAATNTSIIGDTVLVQEFSTELFYFGKLNANTKYGVSPINLLPSSKCVMTLTIDRIRHPSTTFAIKNKCVP